MPSLRLKRLEFSSVLRYPSLLGRVAGNLQQEAQGARNLILQLKGAYAGAESTKAADGLVRYIRTHLATLTSPSGLLAPPVVLVPVPRSSLRTKGGLWPAQLLAERLHAAGLGSGVSEVLSRAKPLPKSALSIPTERPSVFAKYDSLRLARSLDAPSDVTLVDDVVTTGAEFLAAANRLIEVFPDSRIRAFAAARTMSGPPNWPFGRTVDPVRGAIVCRPDGVCWRDP